MKHLLSIDDLGREGIDEVLSLAEQLVEPSGARDKASAFAGKTVATLFFESSTRTRVSFEMAALKLGARILELDVGTSSLNKGESIRDTSQTIAEMGVDALIVRHASAGVAQQIARWTDTTVVNAGDGSHQHPTQALLDCLTLRQELGRNDLNDVRVLFVGDFANSRVVRSSVQAFSALGADITVVASPTMHPSDMSVWPVTVSYDLDDVIGSQDVIYSLRPKTERLTSGAVMPSTREYIIRYCITLDRFARLGENVRIMDAGPVLRGVQMAAEVLDDPRCLVNRQVANGVPTRMAVLLTLLERSHHLPVALSQKGVDV